MSRPWMKFYPADWQADPALRSCSLAARGLWIEMLCIMQKAEPVGRLTINGNPPSTASLAVLTGSSVGVVVKGLRELETAGVFSREGDVIFSRRMVRDEERTERDKANGSKGGNPRLKAGVNPPDKPTVNGGDKAQSPEARSQKESTARGARLPDGLLDRIWTSAPAKARDRSSRKDVERTLAAAIGRGGDPDVIAESLTAYFSSEDASKDGGAFAKGVHRMIEGDRWQDWAPDARAVSHSDQTMTRDDWARRMMLFREKGAWPGTWGPKPGEYGCEVPADLQAAP